jgi:gp16 family phage-associated protein
MSKLLPFCICRHHKDATMKSAARARKELNRRGISVTEFAKQNQLPRDAVFYVLRGGRALRGYAHNAAVLLGIKQGQLRELAKTQDKQEGVR